jgi:hypothetical protein
MPEKARVAASSNAKRMTTGTFMDCNFESVMVAFASRGIISLR